MIITPSGISVLLVREWLSGSFGRGMLLEMKGESVSFAAVLFLKFLALN